MNEQLDLHSPRLSEAGLARKGAILQELQREMRRRVVQRRAARVGGGIALTIAMVVGGVVLWQTAWGVGGGVGRPSPAAPAHPAVANATLPVDVEGSPISAPVNVVQHSARRLEVIDAAAVNRLPCVVLTTDAASVEKFVISTAALATPRVEILEDDDLLRTLAGTGNVYGLVRVGDHAELTCYTCVPSPTTPSPSHGGAGTPPLRSGDV